MDAVPTPLDADRELKELRARAYGPDPDIQDDPAALARLLELEAQRAGDRLVAAVPEIETAAGADALPGTVAVAEDAVSAPDRPPPPEPASTEEEPAATSRWRRPTSPRSRRLWLAAGAGVAVVAVAYGVTRLLGPHPDATLWPTSSEVDDQVLAILRADVGGVARSSLQAYETFRGIEPWSGLDFYGNPCLILVERSTSTVQEVACTPEEAELMADLEVWPAFDDAYGGGLPDGTVIRFHLNGNTVDAFVHPPPADG